MTVSRHEMGSCYPRPEVVERYLAIYDGDVTEAEIRSTYLAAQSGGDPIDQPDKEPAL